MQLGGKYWHTTGPSRPKFYHVGQLAEVNGRYNVPKIVLQSKMLQEAVTFFIASIFLAILPNQGLMGKVVSGPCIAQLAPELATPVLVWPAGRPAM